MTRIHYPQSGIDELYALQIQGPSVNGCKVCIGQIHGPIPCGNLPDCSEVFFIKFSEYAKLRLLGYEVPTSDQIESHNLIPWTSDLSTTPSTAESS